MSFKNLTPHPVVIMDSEGNVLRTFVSEGSIRLDETITPVKKVDGIQINRTKFGSSAMPEPQEGTYLIVSRMVIDAFPEREDLVCPSEIVRNEAGQIVGCQSLSH